MKMVLLLINLFIINKLICQPNEYTSQLTGQNSFINFPSGISNTGSQLNTTEGCSSICDSDGNLLFYSDGVRVWDRFHNQMPNGFGLLGNTSSSQSSLIFKMPDSDDMYYIFTAPETSTNNAIHYSIVNKNANSGNGDIILKNLLPFMMNIQSTEKLTFTYHCNNKDIWVLSKDRNNNTYRAWLVTSSGLSAWTFTNIGFSIGNNLQSNIGCMKISTDGSKLAVCHYGDNRVYLYDFNNQTGVISNERLLSSTFIGPYGCEFSENSRYLYVGYNNGLNIHRYDVTNVNPASTRTAIATNVGSFVGQFQRIGPIIFIAQSNTFFLDAITNADNGGVFNQNYLSTLNRINFGLNQILYSNLTIEPIIMTD
jgi:hypothetical protein